MRDHKQVLLCDGLRQILQLLRQNLKAAAELA
jgi:hypothetical protein